MQSGKDLGSEMIVQWACRRERGEVRVQMARKRINSRMLAFKSVCQGDEVKGILSECLHCLSNFPRRMKIVAPEAVKGMIGRGMIGRGMIGRGMAYFDSSATYSSAGKTRSCGDRFRGGSNEAPAHTGDNI